MKFWVENQRDFDNKFARKSPEFETAFPLDEKVLLSEGFHQPSSEP